MIEADLQTYIETQILPRYEAFDSAHRLDHVQTVMDESVRLARLYGLDERIAWVAAAYHDTGLEAGRKYHHLRSGEIIAADKELKRWFSDEEILLIREAAEDHRASAEREPRSLYGQIVAEADRVIDPELTLRRTVQYGLRHYPELDKEGHYARFRSHLVEKYGPNGYLKLYIPASANARRLACLRAILANEELLRSRFEELFDGEM